MRLAYVTNLPAPYRVAFLNELGRLCDLTVFFERHSASDRDLSWRGDQAQTYREVYCADRPFGTDRSLGLDLMRRIRAERFDRLLISGYSSPAVMTLILDCQRRKQPYYMQYDGGFDTGKGLRNLLKRKLLRPAAGHFTSSETHAAYLRSLGIMPELIWRYPFTSLSEEDILPAPISEYQRTVLRTELGVTEKYAVIAVGRFIWIKGFDVLLEAARQMKNMNVGFYFVGGEATREYIAFCKTNGLSKVHFIGFQKKEALSVWYRAADLFCLPTRNDIWGLVVDEALANCVPVVTTTSCGAGLELVRDGFNGELVPPENPDALRTAIERVLSGEIEQMRRNALDSVRNRTVKTMAIAHLARLAPQP